MKSFSFLVIFLVLSSAASAQTVAKNVQKAADGTNAITESLTFGSGKTLTLSGVLTGTPTSGTLDLSALTLTPPSNIVTLTGSQTLTNKTLTTPNIGAATGTSVTGPSTTDLTLQGGSSGASLVLQQGGSGKATLNRPLVSNGGSTANADSLFQAKINSTFTRGLAISNVIGDATTIDPWFHVTSVGIGALGNYDVNPSSPTIPFFSIEADTALSSEIRTHLVPTGNYAYVWTKTTNHASRPMDMYLKADRNVYLHSGANNDGATDNSGQVIALATSGTLLRTGVVGAPVTYASFAPSLHKLYTSSTTNLVTFDNGGFGTGERMFGNGDLTIYSNAGKSLYLGAGGAAGITIAPTTLTASFSGALNLAPITAPASPASGWTLYVDSGDGNKLKAKASTGTVVTLGTP